MGSKRLRVVPSSRSEDPARLSLDQAIKAAAKAREALAGHQAAIERARQQVAVSARKADEARDAITVAKGSFEGEMAAALADGRPIPATSAALKTAETKALDATRSADAVAVAYERLKTDLRSYEIDVHVAGLDVATAVDAIVAPLATELLERAETARRTLFQAAALLSFFARPDDAHRSDLFWKPNEWKTAWHAGDRRRAPMGEINKQIENFLAKFRQDLNTGADEALARWKLARQALKDDPTAALPELPGET